MLSDWYLCIAVNLVLYHGTYNLNLAEKKLELNAGYDVRADALVVFGVGSRGSRGLRSARPRTHALDRMGRDVTGVQGD